MTRDDIIRMAREAGFNHPSSEKNTDYYKLERFAALVAAAEREACAKVCEDRPIGTAHDNGKACADAIRARGQA